MAAGPAPHVRADGGRATPHRLVPADGAVAAPGAVGALRPVRRPLRAHLRQHRPEPVPQRERQRRVARRPGAQETGRHGGGHRVPGGGPAVPAAAARRRAEHALPPGWRRPVGDGWRLPARVPALRPQGGPGRAAPERHVPPRTPAPRRRARVTTGRRSMVRPRGRWPGRWGRARRSARRRASPAPVPTPLNPRTSPRPGSHGRGPSPRRRS